MPTTIRWGIIGPGAIAREFYEDLINIKEEQHSVKAIAGHSKETTREFLKEHPVEHVFYSTEDLINSGEVDCVYVATPHPFHYKACLQLLEARIPVLCEKPLAISERQVTEIINKSAETKTFLMEGMWIRCLPSIEYILEIISSGKIGEVKSIEGRLTYKAPYDIENRYFNPEKGGGSLLDLGIYPAYLSYLILGKPDAIKAVSSIEKTGVDGGTAALLTHKNGTYSLIESSFIKKAPNEATIYGEKGGIHICEPWNEKPDQINLQIYNGEKDEYKPLWPGKGLYFEVIEMMKCIRQSKIESPLLSHSDSLELVKMLDEIRLQSGIHYPNE